MHFYSYIHSRIAKKYSLTVCVAILYLLAALAGCNERSFGPSRQSDKPQQDSAAAVKIPDSGEAMLAVGGTLLPMPPPPGFKRMPRDHELVRITQSTLGSSETLLCLFERDGALGAPGTGPHIETWRDNLRVSTLSKWFNARITAQDFLKAIEPWKKDSVIFNQNTLSFFEESAAGHLLNEPEYSYNMGIMDSSPLHISFLKVAKRTAPGGEPVYQCITASVLWRQGKVLNITYSRNIESFDQIQDVVAESISYIGKLLSLDRAGEIPKPA